MNRDIVYSTVLNGQDGSKETSPESFAFRGGGGGIHCNWWFARPPAPPVTLARASARMGRNRSKPREWKAARQLAGMRNPAPTIHSGLMLLQRESAASLFCLFFVEFRSFFYSSSFLLLFLLLWRLKRGKYQDPCFASDSSYGGDDDGLRYRMGGVLG